MCQLQESPEALVNSPAPHGKHALLPVDIGQHQMVRPNGTRLLLCIMHGLSDSPDALEKEPIGHAAHVKPPGPPMHGSQLLRHVRVAPSGDASNDNPLEWGRCS